MAVLVKHLALVSETARVTAGDLAIVSAALQKQVTRDLAPIWDISATVDAFARLDDVPTDYWPLIVMDDIRVRGAAGIHLNRDDGQPYALITARDERDDWSLTASHECLEMLVDPSGDRLVGGDSTKDDQGRVNFLVEVSDPSEAAQFAYSVNGVLVSDFYTPHFFDPLVAPGVRYSFTGAITEPRQVLHGGYLSWQDPATNTWWQETWFGGPVAQFRTLGALSRDNGSFREQIDRLTVKLSEAALLQGRGTAERAGLAAASASYTDSTGGRAARMRTEIQALCDATEASSTPTTTRRRPGGRR